LNVTATRKQCLRMMVTKAVSESRQTEIIMDLWFFLFLINLQFMFTV
jgi:hypothetical protein